MSATKVELHRLLKGAELRAAARDIAGHRYVNDCFPYRRNLWLLLPISLIQYEYGRKIRDSELEIGNVMVFLIFQTVLGLGVAWSNISMWKLVPPISSAHRPGMTDYHSIGISFACWCR